MTLKTSTNEQKDAEIEAAQGGDMNAIVKIIKRYVSENNISYATKWYWRLMARSYQDLECINSLLKFGAIKAVETLIDKELSSPKGLRSRDIRRLSRWLERQDNTKIDSIKCLIRKDNYLNKQFGSEPSKIIAGKKLGERREKGLERFFEVYSKKVPENRSAAHTV